MSPSSVTVVSSIFVLAGAASPTSSAIQTARSLSPFCAPLVLNRAITLGVSGAKIVAGFSFGPVANTASTSHLRRAPPRRRSSFQLPKLMFVSLVLLLFPTGYGRCVPVQAFVPGQGLFLKTPRRVVPTFECIFALESPAEFRRSGSAAPLAKRRQPDSLGLRPRSNIVPTGSYENHGYEDPEPDSVFCCCRVRRPPRAVDSARAADEWFVMGEQTINATDPSVEIKS